MNLDDFERGVGLLILVIVAVASVVAYFRASYAKATIVTLSENNEAQAERIKLLEDDTKRQKEQIIQLQQENTILRDMVTGKAEVEVLAAGVRKLGDDMMKGHRDMLAILRNIESRAS